jgi:hypothetical protein
VGIAGKADELVRAIGLLCSPPSQEQPSDTAFQPTATVGFEQGRPFQRVCPGGTAAIGATGRSGTLIDAAGVLCAGDRS